MFKTLGKIELISTKKIYKDIFGNDFIVENDNYYLYEKVAYQDCDYQILDNDSNAKFYLYSDIYRKNLVDSGKDDYDGLDISKYYDQLNTYKYTFKIENNNFYFYSIEKVKYFFIDILHICLIYVNMYI